MARTEASSTAAGMPASSALDANPGVFSGTVFLNTRGRPWNRHSLGIHMRYLKRRHGIQTVASLHGIRHTAATEAIRNGASLKYVSLMLGHASQQTTESFYVHVDNDIEAIRAAAALSQPKK